MKPSYSYLCAYLSDLTVLPAVLFSPSKTCTSSHRWWPQASPATINKAFPKCTQFTKCTQFKHCKRDPKPLVGPKSSKEDGQLADRKVTSYAPETGSITVFMLFLFKIKPRIPKSCAGNYSMFLMQANIYVHN